MIFTGTNFFLHVNWLNLKMMLNFILCEALGREHAIKEKGFVVSAFGYYLSFSF